MAMQSKMTGPTFAHALPISSSKSIGRWVLEKYHAYNPYSGITNNQSEGLNRVVKDLQMWKEAPIDSMMLSLFQLQAYYHDEIKRGFSDLGEYQTKKKFWALVSSAAAVTSTIYNSRSPENMVKEGIA